MNKLIASRLGVRWRGAGAALLSIGALMLGPGSASAQPGLAQWRQPCGLRDVPAADAGGALQRLLGKIKERYPGGSILTVRRTTLDLEGLRLVYRVKVLPADGRIVWLVYDATTLEPPEAGSDHATATQADRECQWGRS